MSALSQKSRIQRKEKPPKYYASNKPYRQYLFRDFEGRCAYSMAHYMHSGGETAMHVEHFNPHLPKGKKNEYENLFLATSNCNGRKLDFWPNQQEQADGIRYLNPCEEHDYGVHIFEDPETFEVWGDTEAGRYQVRMMRLNASHLVEERRLRHQLRQSLSERGYLEFTGETGRDERNVIEGLAFSRRFLDFAILPIAQRKKPTSVS